MFSKRIRKEKGEEGSSAPDRAADEADEEQPAKLVCTGCRHPITVETAALEIAGRHRHTCVNPAGIVYKIRCFREASGCVGQGEVTDYFSWFAGYAWQIALCQKCAMHLGWRFTGADPPFHGLVAERITREDG